MFESKDVAHGKPSSFCSKSRVFGSGNGFLLILLFNSQKSERNCTRLFFFGPINVGAAHSDLFIFLSTPILQSLSHSFLVASSKDFGIGKGLAWQGFTPSFNSKLIGGPFHLPSCPSKRSSYLFN